MVALPPNGWAQCELRFHHHPSQEQAYANYIEGKTCLKIVVLCFVKYLN
jgi:hypothetical protein